MNILITCAGRRAYLVEYFREVVGPLGGRVITANSEFFAAGLLAGDRRYVVPQISDPQYIPTLLKIVADEKISLVLSVFDIDLPVLAAARDQFKALGAEVAISDPETIEIAGDKWRMFEFFSGHGIPTPRTWLDPAQAVAAVESSAVTFPLFVKPRWGMGSVGVYAVNNIPELHAAVQKARDAVVQTYLHLMAPGRISEAVLIQEFISGTEYGADVFNDLNGHHLATAVKQKISQRPEGADFAFTVEDPTLTALCLRLSDALRHRSNLDVDIIWPKGGHPYVVEVNARFGGGYPFSHLAGARFPRALIQLVRGESPQPGKIQAGVHVMLDIQPRTFDPTQGVSLNNRTSK